MAFSPIYTGTDGTISITGLTLNPAGSIVTGATVTGTLRDSAGNVVANWNNLAMSDQGGGTYPVGFTAANVPGPGNLHIHSCCCEDWPHSQRRTRHHHPAASGISIEVVRHPDCGGFFQSLRVSFQLSLWPCGCDLVRIERSF